MRTASRTPSIDVEQALIDAAARLLEADGVEGLSVRRIAAEAKVAPMGVYNRFGGKNGVLDALLTRGFNEFDEAMADLEGGDPIATLVEAGARYRTFARSRPAVYRLMFDRAVVGWEPSAEALENAASPFDRIVGYVREAMAAGAIHRDDDVEVAQRLWSNCHGSVSLELRGLGFVADIDRHQWLLVRTMLVGLGADPEAGALRQEVFEAAALRGADRPATAP